jgi:hypothetical protein
MLLTILISSEGSLLYIQLIFGDGRAADVLHRKLRNVFSHTETISSTALSQVTVTFFTGTESEYKQEGHDGPKSLTCI